jgi:hypothetical protein
MAGLLKPTTWPIAAHCNQRKGSDLTSIDPETSQIVPLFHPRKDQWTDHFRISEGLIEPLTAVGRVTVQLLRLNVPDRIEERKQLAAAGLLPRMSTIEGQQH